MINGFDRNQVAEIRRFWNSRNTRPQVQQQAPQVALPAQSPFTVQQQPVQTAPGPMQSPFAAQQVPQTALPAQSPFAAQQPIQAPEAFQMAPQAQATLVTLQSIYNLLQQLLAANTARTSAKAP